MRIALAVLAWTVLVVVVLGSFLSVASDLLAIHAVAFIRSSPGAASMLFFGVARALFNTLIAVGVWAALLYLLDVDKRLRALGASQETI